MEELAQSNCIPCRRGDPPLSASEVESLRAQVPEWEVVEREGVLCLQRVFKFKNFAQALAFTNRIGALAEEQDHHPALLTEWGRVTVSWWTHAVGGLHRNDFIMAAKTDRAYQEMQTETAS
ncbi:MAG: 4a-hydroxytetrahydrobiopterin dehydratase [Anaerolineales bacterium]|nr:4a-hydroxytetrahydrobiopterin dehydratase [Anaerolineales bacterium]MDW8446627.1 4a-hydroxytetrahydrobiopterin dehydratase [Anaerolineales bacterium]